MKESDIHKSIIEWTKQKYPTVLINTDSSGIKLNVGQAMQMKRLRNGNGYPDISIYSKGSLGSALFIEVKNTSPYKNNGELFSETHLQEQDDMRISLLEQGYHCEFVWSLEQAKELITRHLNHITPYNVG